MLFHCNERNWSNVCTTLYSEQRAQTGRIQLVVHCSQAWMCKDDCRALGRKWDLHVRMQLGRVCVCECMFSQTNEALIWLRVVGTKMGCCEVGGWALVLSACCWCIVWLWSWTSRFLPLSPASTKLEHHAQPGSRQYGSDSQYNLSKNTVPFKITQNYFIVLNKQS